MEIFSSKCRKHPMINQQPGICSACLRDRLLQLADTYNHNTKLHTKSSDHYYDSSTSTSSSPTYFSSFVDKQQSTDRRRAKHVRNASDVVRTISYVVTGGGELMKSRSIATIGGGGGGGGGEVGRKRGSIWKKLLRIRQKKATMLRDGFEE